MALHIWMVKARRIQTAVGVRAARPVARIPLVAGARVLAWALVVAGGVRIAVVLVSLAVEDLGAVDAVVEDVPRRAVAGVRVRSGVDAALHASVAARAGSAVVDVMT